MRISNGCVLISFSIAQNSNLTRAALRPRAVTKFAGAVFRSQCRHLPGGGSAKRKTPQDKPDLILRGTLHVSRSTPSYFVIGRIVRGRAPARIACAKQHDRARCAR